MKRTPPMWDAVVIGVSAGGMTALGTILPCLSSDYRLPVIVVQHMHPESDDFLSRYLDKKCRITVRQATANEPILTRHVYVAPPNCHLTVNPDRTFSLSRSEPVLFARPSIDVLFVSAAAAYGPRLVGVILTGASSDGAKGLKAIKSAGGIAVVQDPRTAEADIMPKAAVAAGDVDFILPLDAIGKFLARLSNGGTL